MNVISKETTLFKNTSYIPSHIKGIKVIISGRMIKSVSLRKIVYHYSIGSFKKSTNIAIQIGSFSSTNKNGIMNIKV